MKIGKWSLTSLQQRLVKTRTPDQACPLLLAAAGGGSPHAAAVWEHAAKDRGAPHHQEDRRAVDRNRFQYRARLEREKCLRNGLEKRQF